VQSVTCNLDAWRERERLPDSQLTVLDAEDGAGWDLARALLRPRKLQARAACCGGFCDLEVACA
jgi:hypothetical protein